MCRNYYFAHSHTNVVRTRNVFAVHLNSSRTRVFSSYSKNAVVRSHAPAAHSVRKSEKFPSTQHSIEFYTSVSRTHIVLCSCP